MCDQCKETKEELGFTVTVSPVTVDEQRITLVGAAGIFGLMSDQAMDEGKEDMAKACYFAAKTLEQMARGSVPIMEFSDIAKGLEYALNRDDELTKALEELDNQENPVIVH